jgi:hypothetical protein
MAVQGVPRAPVSPYLGMTVGLLLVSTAAIAVRFAQKQASSLGIAIASRVERP